jgi:hypothetical protein
MNEKQRKAAVIIDEMHALLHTEERRNQGEVTYLGIARMTGRIGEHFPEGMPPQIQQAVNEALNICSPGTVTAKTNEKAGHGLACVVAGAVIGVIGLVQVLSTGVTEIPERWIGGRFWDWITGNVRAPIIHWSGPLCIAAGVILVACGIYFLNRKASPKLAAVRATEILRAGIMSWATDSTSGLPPSKAEPQITITSHGDSRPA